jgi:hypothetical protein
VNVAVISSSPVNLFAAALVARLAADDRPPVAIICTQRSRMAMARGYLRKHGIWKTLDRGLDAVQVRPSRTNSIRKILGEYAVQHGLTQWDVPLRTAADRFGVEFVETESLNAASAVGYVRTRGINVLLNAHMGYLPMYRGYNVLEWSLFRGDPIGVTLHFIDTGIDTGDIIRFQPIAVEPSDSLEDLRAKTFPVDIEQMVYAVRQLEGGVLSGTAQAEAEGRQYFSMHRRLIAITRKRLAARVSGRAVRT